MSATITKTTIIANWAVDVNRALSVLSCATATPSVVSDCTLVDSDVGCAANSDKADSPSSSFFVAGSGTMKVKATISAFGKSHGRHADCAACKAKQAAKAEAQKKREEKKKAATEGVKNARPMWKY